MKFLLLIGLAVIGLASALRDPCACPRIYLPVCGSDGKTYGNKCMFNCEKQTKNPGLKLVKNGECENQKLEEHLKNRNEILETDPCNCVMVFDPVCGTDGETYPNKCELDCVARHRNPELKVKYEGECHAEMAELKVNDPCNCLMVFEPVCGTDGETYPNKCELDCVARHRNPELKVKYEGECHAEMAGIEVTDPCICDRTYMPVCGTDGKTYANKCLLNCAAKTTSPGLQMKHLGECHEGLFLATDHCICLDNYKPVCGSDGKTYSNLCRLNCQSRQSPELKLDHAGECEHMLADVTDPCVCDRTYLPVCGTDNKTYANKCLLNCAAKTTSPGLRMWYLGTCHAVFAAAEPCICLANYEPVCGTDGKTYSNLCVLNCQIRLSPKLGLAHGGECGNMVAENFCTMEYNPVCGSDGRTYGNLCSLNSMIRRNPELKLAHAGECGNMAVEKPCICTMEYNPVCGSDGRTYGNLCSLNCMVRKNPELTLAHGGECGNMAVEKSNCYCGDHRAEVCAFDGHKFITYKNVCEYSCAARDNAGLKFMKHSACDNSPCICTKEYNPVCGSDGHTYGNLCTFNCMTRNAPDLTLVKHGQC